MKIRFIRSCGKYKRGQVIEPEDGAAREYLRRGVAEPVEESVETATYPKRVKR